MTSAARDAALSFRVAFRAFFQRLDEIEARALKGGSQAEDDAGYDSDQDGKRQDPRVDADLVHPGEPSRHQRDQPANPDDGESDPEHAARE